MKSCWFHHNMFLSQLGTFGDDVQAMDYVQAKIHSLVTLVETDDVSTNPSHLNPERIRFRDMEQNFRKLFHMPKREKLVNCEWRGGGSREEGAGEEGAGEEGLWDDVIVNGISFTS